MMVQKIVTFDVALKSTERQWVQKVPEVYTNDLGSVSIQFKITDCTDTELTGATAIVLLKMRDGSFFQGPSPDVKRTLNVFSYTLKENEGNHDGLAEIQLVVTIATKKFATQKCNFKVITGLDSEVAREVMIYDWSTLTAEARVYIDQFTADEILRDAEFDNAQFDRSRAFNADQAARVTAFNLAEANRAAGYDSDHSRAGGDHAGAVADRANASTDRTKAAADRTLAATDHTTAAGDHTQALANNATVAGFNARVTAEETATAANKISAVKAKTFADVDARLEDVEFDTVLMATNKVVNGDLASGLTGWSALYASLSAANNVLSITGDGTNATPRVYQITTGKITANTKIYATQLVKVTNAVCSNITIELKSDPTLSALGVFGSVTSPTQDVAYRVSGIVQAPSGYDNNNIVLFVRDTYADGTTASGKVLQLSVPIVLNLTEIFGVGNEPTSAQMDRLLTQFQNSWFTGTENLFLAKWALNELRRLDNDKANKTQEAWITPTLVNGATGTFQYRKNEFGRLEFKGELKQASTASYFAITIAGYRPPAWIRCPITSIDGAVSMLVISDGGALYLHTPLAGRTISFSGISINIQ